MNERELRRLLEGVSARKISPERAIEQLRDLPFEDLDFAKVDHHRALRQGYAEVVFAKGKTPAQVAEIVRAMLGRKGSRQNVLVTRADTKIYAAVRRVNASAGRATKFHGLSGVITIERNQEISGKGTICVVSAGTSDIPVAEEALLTARMMGNRVEHLYDVGCRRDSPAPGASREVDERAGGDLHCRYGRCAAQRGWRFGGRAGDCRAHQHWIWRQLWRGCGVARHAE